MQFVSYDINLNIIGKRKIAFYVSLGMIIISILTLVIHGGPKYGIDFAGGTLIQVRFQSSVHVADIKSGLDALGIESPTVQTFGGKDDYEYLIRTDKDIGTEKSFNSRLEQALKLAAGSQAEVRRVEMVGPQVGKDLREKALFAMFFALLFIAIYISWRFEMKLVVSGLMAAALMGGVYFFSIFEVSIPFLIVVALLITLVLFWFLKLKYAMGAIVALIHDVTITVGIFSLFEKEFTLPIIAALLTIIGYSLNDTIIVFDRIRENLKKHHRKPMEFVLNRSVNETLSRTLLTSLTTLVVVLCLLVLGGGMIHDFAFAITIGVIIGTYSSVYVASPILLAWQQRK
jgi:preprotein translocase subunit SecF